MPYTHAFHCLELVSCQTQFIRQEVESIGMYQVPGSRDVIIYSMLHQLHGEWWCADYWELHQDLLTTLRLRCECVEIASSVNGDNGWWRNV